ncbi:MAG: DUF167 domain-containing protein [Proteobacteria bacterium]|nr:DUF167 domain-containing protein [Pseudomonadota bacterium]
MAWYRWQAGALILELKVQPRARHNGVEGLHDDALKVRITAPPVDDKANEALCRWLADDFGAARAAVTVLRGATSRNKVVQIARPTVAPPWFGELGGVWVDSVS